MADSTFDVAQLTEDQQLALQQFTSVTDQPLESAVPLLQRCQWNVQIAIARFFDGEPPEVTTEPDVPPPQDIRRQETLLNGIATDSISTARFRGLEPAPRIVPQPDSQITNRAPLLLTIIFAPFSLVYGILSRTFRIFGWLFPFLPRLWTSVTAARSQSRMRRKDTSGRRPLNPKDTAARFIREFQEEYGDNEVPFFENGYAQAFDLAKKDLKFLVTLLISPEHDDNESFIRETLLSPDVVNFLRDPANNIILWGGNVQDSEAYQVANALNCTKFPFAGVIVHTPSVSSTAMCIVARIAGPTPPGQFISKIRQAIDQNSEDLNRVRATRAEQQAARNLREQQNSAYERSLAQDRERARQKREAEERRKREEEEAREREEAKERYERNLEQWRKWRALSVPAEPGPDVKDVVRISLRMPSGDRIVRRFPADASIEDLYAFVECYDLLQSTEVVSEKVGKPEGFEHEYKFLLVSPMPREAYDLETGGSIKDRIGRSGNLIVELTDLEDSDEEEVGGEAE